MPGSIFHISEEPNFSDEELEDLQNLLWRGYAPPPYQRHELDTYLNGYWRRHMSPKELKAAQRERAKRYADFERELADARAGVRRKVVEQYAEFRCDNCHQTFRSVSDETEIDADYHETFGANATEERLAVCEKCYDLLMKGYVA